MALFSADQSEESQNVRLPSKYTGTTLLNIGPSRETSHLMHSPGSVVSQLIGSPLPGALGGRTSVVPEKASLANGSL